MHTSATVKLRNVSTDEVAAEAPSHRNYPRPYVARLPMYKITLPCGHVFLSLTPAVALGPDGEEDPVDGLASFWCGSLPALPGKPESGQVGCQRYYFLEGWELHDRTEADGTEVFGAEQPPRKPSHRPGRKPRRYAESELCAMYESAVIRDRIAEWFLRWWDTLDTEAAAKLHHWDLRLMRDVGRDLGVFPGKPERSMSAPVVYATDEPVSVGDSSETDLPMAA